MNRGIIIFVEDERFLKHPKFIDINIEEIYTILYDASMWKIFEKIKDEDYMKERVLDIFNFMVSSKYHSDVEVKVVCEESCVEYVRKFLDEKVEVCCLEGEEI